MITKYEIKNGCFEGSATFLVDKEVFAKQAKGTLEFFVWDYNKDEDLIEEALKKYAMMAIKHASFGMDSVAYVKQQFDSEEGYCPVDGSCGIELIEIEGYEFNEDFLKVKIIN